MNQGGLLTLHLRRSVTNCVLSGFLTIVSRTSPRLRGSETKRREKDREAELTEG